MAQVPGAALEFLRINDTDTAVGQKVATELQSVII